MSIMVQNRVDMAKRTRTRNWYPSMSKSDEDDVPARELDASGGMTNQRFLAPPGNVRGVEHDPETSKRLRRPAGAGDQGGERRNRERPIAQTDAGRSRPTTPRNRYANDGNSDRSMRQSPNTNRKPAEDDVTSKTQPAAAAYDQLTPKRGGNNGRQEGSRGEAGTRPARWGGRTHRVQTVISKRG